ncbi:MAG: carboxymuconolactone decarboxylase family protein [Candidatus Dormibacteria bacterium]
MSDASPGAPARFDPGVRVEVEELAPAAAKALRGLEGACRQTTIARGLLELVRLRVAQINGCAYCVDLHHRQALEAGEDPRRLAALAAWSEAPFFTARERAALELAEAETRVSERPVADSVLEGARRHFPERELAELIWVIAVINTWTRIGATARPWRLP